MFIETEATPNPATLKFLPGRDVMGAGTADFAGPDLAERSPLATALFAFSNQIRGAIAPLAAEKGPTLRIAAFALIAVVAVYGGFFGAGMGIMVLAALAVIEEGDFHKANTIKIVMTFLIQLVSASLLSVGGLVHWQPALIIMVTSVIGGYLGVGVARKVPERMVRYAVVIVGLLLTIVFFLK